MPIDSTAFLEASLHRMKARWGWEAAVCKLNARTMGLEKAHAQHKRVREGLPHHHLQTQQHTLV